MRIIFIRGLARESAHWGDFPELLQAHIDSTIDSPSDKVEIITPDLLGCGKNFQMKAAKRIDAYSDHLAHTIFKNITSSGTQKVKTIVVGISMGGMVAIDILKRFGEHIDGVVLINSSTGDQALFRRLRPRVWLPAILSIIGSTRLRERLMLRVVSNNNEIFDQELKKWLDIQSKRPVSRRTILFQLLAAARYRMGDKSDINARNLPGFVFASKSDRMVSYKCSQDIARRMQWPIELHESAGHDLPMDDADWLIEKIGAFYLTLRDE